MPPSDARQRLLLAAISFLESGHTPTTRELTERAGVNVAAVNYHFRSKDRLLAQAVDQAVLYSLNAWVSAELAGGSAAQRLRRLLRHLVDAHRDLPHIGRTQVRELALKDEPEQAAERLFLLLLNLLRELAPSWSEPRQRVAALSLQSSVTFLSLFHARVTPMTGVPVDSDREREAFIDALLLTLGLPSGATP